VVTVYIRVLRVWLYLRDGLVSKAYMKLDLNYSQDGVVSYFTKIGYPCPPHVNPADHIINILNTDFDVAEETGVPDHERVQQLADAWMSHTSGLASAGSESHERSSAAMTSTSAGTAVGAWMTASEQTRLRTEKSKSWSYQVIGEVKKTWILTKRTALIIRRNVVLVSVRIWIYGTCDGFRPLNSCWLKILEWGRHDECVAIDSMVTYRPNGCEGQ
jgi:hypothetical protein